MSIERIERQLRAANPVARPTLAALDIAAGEADLAGCIVAGAARGEAPAALDVAHRGPRSMLALVSAPVAVAATIVVALMLITGGASRSPQPAYGAELVRFAESTPLLLLEGPDWRVQNVTQYKGREGLEGSMEFVTGKPVPYETIRITGKGGKERLVPILPAIQQAVAR